MKSLKFIRPFAIVFLSLIFLFSVPQLAEAKKNKKQAGNIVKIDTSFTNALKYRNIGPFRGGRSAAVTGVKGQSRTFYMGATGGGVWKTSDAGNTWKNISDGYYGGTIGAIAVSESDPNVVYVGGGEGSVRGNVSHGYGIWKSVDAGETWTYSGLKEGQYIPKIRIHPSDHNVAYAAVLGHIFGKNEERGIYKTTDGGKNWEKILYVNSEAGACDLILDPSNPRIIYASSWKVIRTPYSLESGGEGSALWKSTDAGNTWQKLNSKPGFPSGTIGIIGVTVSPVNPKRVWAIIEAEEGGLFRSENGGMSWKRVSEDRNLRQRAWYYSKVYADTKNEDKVYVLNVGFHVSKDGGQTFDRIRTPHGDHHDLWISDENPDIMVVADDGGGQVTTDAGTTWSTYHNQPTAQFYRVATDNHFPYRIYGGQQDNSAVRIKHRSEGRGISENDWESTAGGESGYIVPDPKDPEIVYGGSYGGYLGRTNHRTGERRTIDVWPDNPLGWGAKDLKYRFQWNFPILFSQHDQNVLYCAANVLFKTTNEGNSWEVISPDLTRHDTSTMYPSGGPITKDNTGVEIYATIFAVAESIQEEGVIWAGSDDGLMHITRDGGENWTDITPATSIMPEWTMINSIEASPYKKGAAYVAATGYKKDDFAPYLLKTEDYGASWTLITAGIDPDHFTRVVRADPERDGLLYAGTESGMYISMNDGLNWQSFQLNLPVVPITDLTIKNSDLIIATQGRSFWVLDDLSPLHAWSAESNKKSFEMFSPRPAYRIFGSGGGGNNGQNPPKGVILNFILKEVKDDQTVRLDILEKDGKLVKSYQSGLEKKSLKPEKPFGLLEVKEGLNRFAWDMRYPGVKRFDGLIMWAGMTSGPNAAPGDYIARLVVENDSSEVAFKILKKPNTSSSDDDLKAQFEFLMECRDKLTETHETIIEIRKMRTQMDQVKKNLDETEDKEILDFIKKIGEESSNIEKALYQTKNRSSQDPLNYPIRLNNKLATLATFVSMGDYRPTDQAYLVKDDLIGKINVELNKFKELKKNDIPRLNKMVLDKKIELIKL